MLFQKAVVKKHIALLVSLIMVSVAIISCETDPMAEDNAGYYEIPRVTQGQNEQIIYHLGYTVSYNHHWFVPNWVAYELTRDELNGNVKRTNNYKADPQDIIAPVQPDEYTHSDYDRGLMAPAADMKWSEQAMKECHYMTNVCPQKSEMNSGDWLRIETKVRKWAKDYKKVYIACGPIVKEPYATIGLSREIAVPKSFYKVCLIKKSFNKWSAIGFVMDNGVTGSNDLKSYVKTVDEIESLVGIDFFINLPDEIEEDIEANITENDWFY